jgi:hypothetical protein
MALTAAERQRRKRERDRAGRCRIVLDLDENVVDDLKLLAGLLDCDDSHKVGAAIAQAVERLARRHLESHVTKVRGRLCYGIDDDDE